jgi:hypothetical protein
MMKLGVKHSDALHIACAIEAGCKYFITTDNKLTNKTNEDLRIINPIDFVREFEDVVKSKFPAKMTSVIKFLIKLPFEMEYTPQELPEHNYFTIRDADMERY